MKARSVVGSTTLRWSYKILCHPFTRAIGVLILLGLTFQALPQASTNSNAHYTIGELVLHALSPITKYTPTFFGLWTVEAPRGIIVDNFPPAEAIVEEAHKITPLVEQLVKTRFFRIFKVDLSQECPFWARADLCSSPTGSCGVCECTPDQIPLPWKQKPVEHFVDRRHYEQEEVSPWIDPRRDTGLGLPGSAGEAEFSFLDLLSGQTSDKSTYVDLSLNPPGFTDYKGRNIWGLIYKENCIRDDESSEEADAGLTAFDTKSPGQCTEEEIFEKMISGLQTAVMTLASEYNAPLNWNIALPFSAKSSRSVVQQDSVKSGLVAPRHFYNMDLFRWRVAPNRQWIENLYLDYSILLRTLARVSGVVESCPCYTGTEIEDSKAKGQLLEILETVKNLPSGNSARFTQPLFRRKQDLAIQQFTNISRIFDCIECEKCRLHGKVKLTALQVALKATSGSTPVRSLERNEITALVNAIGYFGDAILIVSRMQRRVQVLRSLTLGLTMIIIVSLVYSFGLYGRFFSRYIPTQSDSGTSIGDNNDPTTDLTALVQEEEKEKPKKKSGGSNRNLRHRVH